MSNTKNRPRYFAHVKSGKPDKPIWIRVGAAFENDKGTLSLVLDANPIDGRIWLFPPKTNGQSSSDEPFTA